MAKIYYEKDADPSLITNKKVGIIGYGSQGHAHALNLRDSGVDVMVGLHEGSASRAKAEAEGLKVSSPAEVTKASDVIMVLVPDTVQGSVYKDSIEPNLDSTKTFAIRTKMKSDFFDNSVCCSNSLFFNPTPNKG